MNPVNPHPIRLGRREFAGATVATLLGSMLKGRAAPCPEDPVQTFTLVHMTDIHTSYTLPHEYTERGRLAMQDIRRRKPSIVINTGDNIDGSGDTAAMAKRKETWDYYMAELQGIPVHSILGNHDTDGGVSTAQAMQNVGMVAEYYTFTHQGWRFLMLNSNLSLAEGSEQRNWLIARLDENKATAMPVCIGSHHPILSISGQIWYPNDRCNNWDNLMVLFRGYPNIKLCLSGHMHVADAIQYDRITYVNGGAVCGYWWGFPGDDGTGGYHQTPAGYAVITLSPAGVVGTEYVTYPDPWRDAHVGRQI